MSPEMKLPLWAQNPTTKKYTVFPIDKLTTFHNGARGFIAMDNNWELRSFVQDHIDLFVMRKMFRPGIASGLPPGLPPRDVALVYCYILKCDLPKKPPVDDPM